MQWSMAWRRPPRHFDVDGSGVLSWSMNTLRLKPIVVVLAVSLSGLAQAESKPVEDKWFPHIPNKPQVQTYPSVDMPDVEPLVAQSCTGELRSFETPGSRQGMQRSRALRDYSDEAARAPGMVSPKAGFAPPMSTGAMSKSSEEASMPMPSAVASVSLIPPPQQEVALRARFVDDNADYIGFVSFLAARKGVLDDYRPRDIYERHGLDVRDARGRPVQGAVVSMDMGILPMRPNTSRTTMQNQPLPAPGYRVSPYEQGKSNWKPVAISDVNGRAWVFPKAVSSQDGPYRLTVGFENFSRDVVIDTNRKARTKVILEPKGTREVPRLDLSIVIDTTGSMSDEIRKLQNTLTKVVGEVERQGVDVCVNVTAYRDVDDAYILKGIDFTSNLGAVQTFVNDLRAEGGGDEPEALNQALDHVVNKLSWRKQDNVVRSVMLITDAPPKMDTAPIFYDRSMLAAGARGIRVHSVGTSGLNTQGGEVVLRQVAQYTGGKFVFLTYKDAASPSKGAGDATVHAVENYSVDTLDALLLRLVKDDLGVESPTKR